MSQKISKELYEPQKSVLRTILDYIVITFASLLISIAVSLFLDPNSLAPGGVTGLSIILSELINIETGTLIFILNVPVLIIGLFKFGVRFSCATLYSILLISWMSNILAHVSPLTDDRLLAALAGSILMSVGIGIVFKAGASTGGTDVIIKLIRLKYPYIKTGALFLIMDIVVVALSAIVFRDVNAALYAGIAVVVTSYGLDRVLYGRDGAKLIYIISDCSEVIANRILTEMDAGVTYVNGYGAYRKQDKKIIMCVVKIQLAPRAEEIVKQEDPEAFMIVTSAMEIYGKGYKSYFSEKL